MRNNRIPRRVIVNGIIFFSVGGYMIVILSCVRETFL